MRKYDNTSLNYYFESKDTKNITCHAADKINGYSGKCTDDCPFNNCITSLPGKSSVILLKTKTIINILDCHDTGMNRMQIKSLFNEIPEHNIDKWLEDAEKTREKIQRYGIVKYLRV